MADIIASTYELIQEIGSGGGGIVYLANHLRLDKKVVLKADKRKITTSPELLRREVDILKDLTHTYIPKVFDFFVEEDTVYTVMDFIEGESLDKPLKRGEKFPQAQVIEWGKELLQALEYLHSPTHGDPPRGYVHSDIKPANLMLTPYKKICLIDFNIALALGEENVIGCSAGYASPEHYGLDYSTVPDSTGETTVLLSPEELEESVSASASSQKKILPDVRSDIYSAGATLYHLFSGRRPARDATDVTPLTDEEVSPQISKIIAKAMNPNPELRYQTAEEMLYALEHLHENDPRTKKLRKSCIITAVVLGLTLCAGTFTAFTGLKRMQTTENWLKLAEYSANSYNEGNISDAIDYAMEAFPENKTIFTPKAIPEAQAALTDALGVYDLSDGYKSSGAVALDAVPTCLRISPDGKTGACISSGSLVIFDTTVSQVIAQLPAEKSALSEVEFIDNDRLIFAGAEGIAAYDIKSGSTLWTGKPATAITVSADGKTAAGVYKDENAAYVYNAENGELINPVNFGDKKQPVLNNDAFADRNESILALSRNGEFLAVSFEDGSFVVFNLIDPEKGIELFDNTSGYTRYEGGFYGDYLGFSAANDEGSAFAVVDCVEMKQTGGFASVDNYSVYTDENGIRVQTANILVEIDPVTGEQIPLVNMSQTIRQFATDGTHTLVSTNNVAAFFDENAVGLSEFELGYSADYLAVAGGKALVGSRNAQTIRIFELDNNSEVDVLSYDPSYYHDEARLSADEKTVMLFSYTDFRIYDRDGNIVAECEIPDSDSVYDTQYRRKDGNSYLEVTYYDGSVVCYSGADGKVIDQYNTGSVDASISNEYVTEKLRIEVPLHGIPKAYDKESGKLIRELETDSYLVYATQVQDYVVAHYWSSQNSYFYGVLMDDKCQTLAVMPYLCDVVNDKVVFDYPNGKLRESRIYTINELIEKARITKQEEQK